MIDRQKYFNDNFEKKKNYFHVKWFYCTVYFKRWFVLFIPFNVNVILQVIFYPYFALYNLYNHHKMMFLKCLLFFSPVFPIFSLERISWKLLMEKLNLKQHWLACLLPLQLLVQWMVQCLHLEGYVIFN